MKRLAFAVSSLMCGLLVSAAALSHETDVEYLAPPNSADRQLPFSDAVRVGDILYVSGKLGNEAGTMKLVSGGIKAETRKTMEHIKATVERHGFSMDKPIKCTVFLADIAEWGQMNEVYVQFFPENKPARSALGVSGLALGARVEIECMFAR